MRWPRGIRATLSVKLALVFFAVVLGALAIVYLVVVPRLEDRLVDAKIEQLEGSAGRVASELRSSGDVVEFQDTVSFAATNLNARVVVLRRLGEDVLIPIEDSSPLEEGPIGRDRIAREAASTFSRESGRVERGDREFAEVALPLGPEHVVLISAPLEDALANVRLVRESVLVAGLVALLASAVAAFAAARGFTRRLRRLEAAADRIAAGDFEAPVEARGEDEVAQVARAFDSMRLRLADLDRVRREFIANASHELRTPLFSLGGFLELLADEDLDPETRGEFLNETRAQVDRLTRLATVLLDLSRLDAGQLEIERSDVDLAAAARTLADEFRPVAEARGHPLRLTADRAVRAFADEQRVLQIGRILVENALRHTPAGTPFEIAAAESDGHATLAVRDGGPGIPAGEQKHVFDRFYRAGGGQASGSGLGLAIAFELAVKMGGRLQVASEPGDTVFTLALPVHERAAVADVSRENAELAGARPTRT